MRLTPPIRMTLEKALAYIEDDELVEVKKFSDANDRKRAEKAKEAGGDFECHVAPIFDPR